MIINLGYGIEYGKIWEYRGGHLRIYFLEFDRYFKRDGIYSGAHGDFSDNPERFAFLCRATIDLCYYLEWIPDIIHGHDWTAGILPVLLDTVERAKPMGRCGSVFTIHNLQHQGYGPRSLLNFLGIPADIFRADGVEAFGQVNMMKAGLYFANKLTTVSETYAWEIQTPAFGFGLDPVLKSRADDLMGIRNGIDEELSSSDLLALATVTLANSCGCGLAAALLLVLLPADLLAAAALLASVLPLVLPHPIFLSLLCI
jgi:starch synthase